MAPVIAQMSPASQGEGQLLKHPLIKQIPYCFELIKKREELRVLCAEGPSS